MQIAEYITESIRLEQEYIWEVIASRQQRKGRVRGCRVQEEGVMVRAHTPGSKPRSPPLQTLPVHYHPLSLKDLLSCKVVNIPLLQHQRTKL